jgi:hypothetical protein
MGLSSGPIVAICRYVTLRQEMDYQAHGEESVAAFVESKENINQTKTTGLIIEYKEVAMCVPSC